MTSRTRTAALQHVLPRVDASDPQGMPRRVGRYEIRRELGRGTMGVVYEAHDPSLGRTIALKTIDLALSGMLADREKFERRFFAEAQAAARLSHQGIVIVHDIGRDPGSARLFIALEFLPGNTLADFIRCGLPMEWREAVRITARIAEALHHAHSQGVIHRDVKPANIMLLPSGEPKIMDFGISRIEADRPTLTLAGQSFGTPLYMSPEQALGEPVDRRSDIFSLGALAYALLTGREAFRAGNIPAILRRVTEADPPPPSSLVPGVPRDVDHLVGRALAKSPDERYPSGQQLAEDATDILAGRPPRHRAAAPSTGRTDVTPPSAEQRETPPRDSGSLPELDALFAGLTAQAELTTAPAADLSSLLATRVAEPSRPEDGTTRAHDCEAAPCPRDEVSPCPPRTGPKARRRVSVRTALAVLGVVAASLPVALTIRYWTGNPSPTVTTEAASAQAPPPSFSPVAATPAPPSSPPPALVAPPSTEPADEEPTPSAVPEAAPPGDAASADKSAHLFVDFEHPLKSVTLRVWLDGEPILQERLDSIAKKLVAIEIRKGGLKRGFDVTPGRHELRVQVTWDDDLKAERISGVFRAAATRHLEIRLGRLRKNLSVDLI
jgi:serine/threonine protein kinase